jgi:hypothetical protein
MTTQTIRREPDFLDNHRLGEIRAKRGSGPMREFLREAGETLRGIFEAPLRYVMSPRADNSLHSLDETTRRDIGL